MVNNLQRAIVLERPTIEIEVEDPNDAFLLAVSHTDRGDAIRIISARLATNVERKIYEEG